MYKKLLLNELYDVACKDHNTPFQEYIQLKNQILQMNEKECKMFREAIGRGKTYRKTGMSAVAPYVGAQSIPAAAVVGSTLRGLSVAGAFNGGVTPETIKKGAIASRDAYKIAQPYAIVAGILSYPVYRTIRGIFDKCSKACGVYAINTPKRQICMAKCKVVFTKSLYDEAKKTPGISQAKLSKLKMKFENAQERYNLYAKYAKDVGRNPDPHVVPGQKSRFRIPG